MLTAGFVLVGGQSRRMGRDKALLPWKSGVLVEEIAGKLSTVTDFVSLVGEPARYARLAYPCLSDLRPGMGPLSGIETALANAPGELNLILACDMPEIEAAHLRNLLKAAIETGADCVVTADGSGRIHPLCAVYRSACLPAVRQCLDEGRLKVMSLVEHLEAEVVFAGNRISNINTVEDWNGLRSTNVN